MKNEFLKQVGWQQQLQNSEEPVETRAELQLRLMQVEQLLEKRKGLYIGGYVKGEINVIDPDKFQKAAEKWQKDYEIKNGPVDKKISDLIKDNNGILDIFLEELKTETAAAVKNFKEPVKDKNPEQNNKVKTQTPSVVAQAHKSEVSKQEMVVESPKKALENSEETRETLQKRLGQINSILGNKEKYTGMNGAVLDLEKFQQKAFLWLNNNEKNADDWVKNKITNSSRESLYVNFLSKKEELEIALKEPEKAPVIEQKNQPAANSLVRPEPDAITHLIFDALVNDAKTPEIVDNDEFKKIVEEGKKLKAAITKNEGNGTIDVTPQEGSKLKKRTYEQIKFH